MLNAHLIFMFVCASEALAGLAKTRFICHLWASVTHIVYVSLIYDAMNGPIMSPLTKPITLCTSGPFSMILRQKALSVALDVSHFDPYHQHKPTTNQQLQVSSKRPSACSSPETCKQLNGWMLWWNDGTIGEPIPLILIWAETCRKCRHIFTNTLPVHPSNPPGKAWSVNIMLKLYHKLPHAPW